jgi:hypothetical protein
VSLLDTDAGSTPVGHAAFINNVASIDVSTLSAGSHRLALNYTGDAQSSPITSSIFVLTISPLPVTANAVGASVQYRQAIPVITGTLSGVLSRDANNLAAVFSTTATATSLVGQYPVSVTLTGSAAGNYIATLATGSGSVSIGKAASLVALASSNIAPYLGAPVTLTAQVASTTSGIPTGDVVFYDGSTPLSTTAVSATGSAAYTSSAFAGGTHSITAVYGGDANFTASVSTPTVETVAGVPDFTLTATGGVTQSVNPGQNATYNFSLQPQSGVFTAPITLTASGLPAGASAVFSPATIAPGSASAPFTLAIQTMPLTASQVPASSPIRLPLIAFSATLFLMPLSRNERIRASLPEMPRMLLGTLFVLITGAATLTLSGCGAGGLFAESPQTYTVIVTATTNSVSTTLQHTTTVKLIVQ